MRDTWGGGLKNMKMYTPGGLPQKQNWVSHRTICIESIKWTNLDEAQVYYISTATMSITVHVLLTTRKSRLK